MESQVAESEEVPGNLLKSTFRSFHGSQDAHLSAVLGSSQLSLIDVLLEAVQLLNKSVHEILGVGASAFNGHAEKTRVTESGVDGRGTIDEVIAVQKSHGSVVHSLAWATGRVARGGSNQMLHNEQGSLVRGRGVSRLKGQSDVGCWGLAPGSQLTTDVLRALSLIVVLWHGQHLTEGFLDKINVLLVVADTRGHDEALSGSDVVHHELLQHPGIDIIYVVGETESWHAESVVAESRPLQEVLLHGEWIELGQVVEEVVALLVLRSSNVGCQNRSRLKSNVDHHLEHVLHIVLNVVALVVSGLLIVVHGHGSTGHLDHAVVDGLISVLKSLEVSVFESQKGTRGLG